ncbi:MAG: sulfatase-like hydrolase/transferase, partial [Akkermansia sp.]
MYKRDEWGGVTQRTLLWLILLSVVYVLFCDYRGFSKAFRAPIAVFLTAGSMLVLWAALKRWAVVVWAPLLLYGMAEVCSGLFYNTGFNSFVIGEALEADRAEFMAYVTPTNVFLLVIAVMGVTGLIYVQWRCLRGVRRLPAFSFGCLFLLLGTLGATAVPPAKFNYAYLWPIGKPVTVAAKVDEALNYTNALLEQLSALPSPADKPSTSEYVAPDSGVVVVFHLGESLRADRMSINGYSRDTTPWLRKNPDVINFPYCVSSAFSTCDAQPVILTNARRCLVGAEHAMQPTTGSMFELFAKHGFPVYSFFWARRCLEVRFHKVVEMLAQVSVERNYADGLPLNSLPKMKQVLEAHSGKNLLFYINNEGSHVPFQFFDRETAPFAPWAKDFSSPAAQAQEVNNAYDATVHYTDQFFREVSEMLKGRPFVYFYVSDHGEVLGDGGKWGRGAFGEDTDLYYKSPACMVGMFVLASPEFCRLHPHFAEAVQQLRAHSDMLVGHEHIFHTLLGLIGIRTPYYDSSLDLCSPDARPYTGPHPENCPPAAARPL